MNAKSVHSKLNSILKKFDQEVALKELSKLIKTMKKGIN